MSYAQPSPPTIHTLRRTSASATLSQLAGRRGSASCRSRSSSRGTRSRCSLIDASLAGSPSSSPCTRPSPIVAANCFEQVLGIARAACRRPAECRGRTRRCPRTASCTRPGRSLRVGGPRRGGQVAAVDRRATGGVGHDRPVAEQLAHQFQVRRFAAAGAGARELEQRLRELRAFHRVDSDLRAIGHRRDSRKKSKFARARARGCVSFRSMLMALWRQLPCSWPGRCRRTRRSPCNRPAPPGS